MTTNVLGPCVKKPQPVTAMHYFNFGTIGNAVIVRMSRTLTELVKDTAITAVECVQGLSPWNGCLLSNWQTCPIAWACSPVQRRGFRALPDESRTGWLSSSIR